ncbi:MAG: hypothetical protein KDN19_06590 [Verrucomicrobiae bacterium]|nr:hypothetical protein [Verrucomicrobiae bacterium]
MKPEDDPDFQPGFRFSGFDATILIVGALTAIGVAIFWLPLAAVVVAFVVGHFFLFCNVFRIARAPELIWAAAFFGLATWAMLSTRPVFAWSLAFGLSLAIAAILIALETRKPSYHGVGWQRFNPGLKDWWNRVRSGN